jgi:hypothetical protein
MAKAETRIVHKILEALRGSFPGCYLRKVHGNPYQHVGIPDIIGCIDGYFFGLEVKTESGKTSKIQELEGLEIKKSGGCFSVVTNPEEAVRFVRGRLKDGI